MSTPFFNQRKLLRAKSFFKRFSPSSSSSSSTTPQEPPPTAPPATFLCPISSLLMSDPVVIPTGHTFDRRSIQACKFLNFIPPQFNLNLDPNFDFPLIPNRNLQLTILDWCHRTGHPSPLPISPDSAFHLVRGFMSSPPPLSPIYPLLTNPPHPYFTFDAFKEQWFLKKLNKPKFSSKESAFMALVDSPVCSPRILAAIIFYLNNGTSQLQIAAADAIYSLSVELPNRPHIILSGIVPTLNTVAANGIRDANIAATRTLHKLASDKQTHLVLGALGVIPALLKKFCVHFLTHMGRKEAAIALKLLVIDCPRNLEVLVESDGVERLLEAADERDSPRQYRTLALMLLHHMVDLRRAREEVLTGDGLKVLMGMVKEGGVGLNCLGVIHKVCKGSLEKFRKAGRAARVEEVFAEAVDEWGEIEREEDDWGELGKKMAKELVSVMRGECNEGKQLMIINVIGQGVLVQVMEKEAADRKAKNVIDD